jgi:hypothetical protein
MIGRMVGLTEAHGAVRADISMFKVSEGERSTVGPTDEGRGMAQHRARPSSGPATGGCDTQTERTNMKEGLAS